MLAKKVGSKIFECGQTYVALSRIKSFYLNDEPFKELDKKINKFDVKRKYNRRIGITNINIENRAFEEMPNNFKENQNSIKKALLSSKRKKYIALNAIEIQNTHDGVPIVHINDNTGCVGNIQVSISHTDEYATAAAILEI